MSLDIKTVAGDIAVGVSGGVTGVTIKPAGVVCPTLDTSVVSAQGGQVVQSSAALDHLQKNSLVYGTAVDLSTNAPVYVPWGAGRFYIVFSGVKPASSTSNGKGLSVGLDPRGAVVTATSTGFRTDSVYPIYSNIMAPISVSSSYEVCGFVEYCKYYEHRSSGLVEAFYNVRIHAARTQTSTLVSRFVGVQSWYYTLSSGVIPTTMGATFRLSDGGALVGTAVGVVE